jgi:hypothetical protein
VALTGYERVKKWRERHKALANMRRRNKRDAARMVGKKCVLKTEPLVFRDDEGRIVSEQEWLSAFAKKR